MKRIKSSLINFGNPRCGKGGDSSEEEDGGDSLGGIEVKVTDNYMSLFVMVLD